FPHMTVAENLAFPLSVRGMSKTDVKERVKRALSMVQLDAFAGRYPAQLSGGQQQRVAIGRALVYNPPVILLDEPLSNLDAKLREEARVFLRELIIKLGLSALMVT
ncbi:ATP-binding cassette domain-containing protein, partial [Acinetobacter baumannii]|uniref:ATP-binding cassette domain-containing protein n=1 Tax=Acinetobacter baumannii TaxID=470 RepID=UPI0013D20759